MGGWHRMSFLAKYWHELQCTIIFIWHSFTIFQSGTSCRSRCLVIRNEHLCMYRKVLWLRCAKRATPNVAWTDMPQIIKIITMLSLLLCWYEVQRVRKIGGAFIQFPYSNFFESWHNVCGFTQMCPTAPLCYLPLNNFSRVVSKAWRMSILWRSNNNHFLVLFLTNISEVHLQVHSFRNYNKEWSENKSTPRTLLL